MDNAIKLETVPATQPGTIVRSPNGAHVVKVPTIQDAIDSAADAEMATLHDVDNARKLGVRAARTLFRKTYLAHIAPRK